MKRCDEYIRKDRRELVGSFFEEPTGNVVRTCGLIWVNVPEKLSYPIYSNVKVRNTRVVRAWELWDVAAVLLRENRAELGV